MTNMTTLTKSKHHHYALRGYVFVLLAATFWAMLGPLYTLAVRWGTASPLTVIIYRSGTAAAVLFVVLLFSSPGQFRVSLHHWPFFISYGLFGVALFYVGYIYAVLRIGVALAVVLMYTAPGWVAIIAFLWLGETLNRWHILALSFMIVGVILISGAYTLKFSHLDLIGIALGLASGILYALYSVFQKIGLRHYSPWTIQFYGFVIGLVPLLFLQPPAISAMPFHHLPLLLLLLLLGAVPTLAGGLFFAFSVQWLPVSRASILASLEPVIATFLGVIFLHEKLVFWQWVGASLVIFAAVLLRISPPPKRREEMSNDSQSSSRGEDI